MWQPNLLKKYKALKLEIEAMYQPPSQDEIFLTMLGKPSSKSTQKYAIIMPRLPEAATLEALKVDIPEGTAYEIIEALKPSTANKIKYSLQAGQCASAESKTSGRNLTLNVVPMPGKDMEEYATVWADINEALLEDGFLDSWEINCGELKMLCNRKIMEERRKNAGIRDISILAEDVLNLKIALGATQDVNDFLAMLERK
jgi:hypothetical protein